MLYILRYMSYVICQSQMGHLLVHMGYIVCVDIYELYDLFG